MKVKIKKDLYQDFTDQVIKQMENNNMNWFKPFTTSILNGHHNVVSKKCYQGLNCFSIGLSVHNNGFKSNEWATFNQWKNLGANVLKGSKGTQILYWNIKEYEDKNDKDKKVKIPMLKYFVVFNADQVEGYKTKEIETKEIDDWKAHFKTDTFVKNTKANIQVNNKAFYSPSGDFIGMPPKEDFKGDKENTKEQHYYSTLLHELTHWTGHSSRCNRDLQNRFGSKAYAMEELVAEIGSAFLCSHLGITKAPTPNHAKYLNNWLEVLKEDKKAIFKAFSLSKVSSEHLLELDQIETKEKKVA
tara:strand:- start:665 stop:1567 length:903 start_codon:yes stop_codon:yes gene_type:complete